MIEEIVNREMAALGIPYQYWEYEDLGDGIPECYYVGEKIEDPSVQEDGCASGTFVLSGWSTAPGAVEALVGYQRKLKARYGSPVHVKTDVGAAVLEYSSTAHVSSDVEGVHRLETNLNYHEWSVEQ